MHRRVFASEMNLLPYDFLPVECCRMIGLCTFITIYLSRFVFCCSPGRSSVSFDHEIVMMNHVYRERFPKVCCRTIYFVLFISPKEKTLGVEHLTPLYIVYIPVSET